MESLLNENFNRQIIDRILKLKADTPAQWGKMNVSQMLSHCQIPLRMASGQLKVKSNPVIRFLFGNAAKKSLLKGAPFRKNLPTFKEAVVTGQKDFETEKQGLIELVKKFGQRGEAGISKEEHPFFGELKPAEWDLLQAKHLDHHLRQFGA